MKSLRLLNGYRVVYAPLEPNAMRSGNWVGYIYEHIKVAQHSIGRPIRPNETVHHLDGNVSNNRHENLIVILRSEHCKLHVWLRTVRIISHKSQKVHRCCICGSTLQDKQIKTCSNKCAIALRHQCSKRPSKLKLQQQLNLGMSYCALGRMYGVSDNAVRKWARYYKLL